MTAVPDLLTMGVDGDKGSNDDSLALLGRFPGSHAADCH